MIQHIAIEENTTGDHTLVAAVPGQPIIVLAYTLVVADAVNVTFAGASGDLSGSMPFAANGGASPPYNPAGHFVTAPGEALLLNLDDNVAVAGHMTVQIGGGLRL